MIDHEGSIEKEKDAITVMSFLYEKEKGYVGISLPQTPSTTAKAFGNERLLVFRPTTRKGRGILVFAIDFV